METKDDVVFDEAVMQSFKAYAAGTRLPGGFTGRFVKTVRRRRALRRMAMAALVCAMAAVCVAVAPFQRGTDAPQGGERPSMTARTKPAAKTAKVSCFMLLGYLRDCIMRTRFARRKEEEQDKICK